MRVFRGEAYPGVGNGGENGGTYSVGVLFYLSVIIIKRMEILMNIERIGRYKDEMNFISERCQDEKKFIGISSKNALSEAFDSIMALLPDILYFSEVIKKWLKSNL